MHNNNECTYRGEGTTPVTTVTVVQNIAEGNTSYELSRKVEVMISK